MNYKTIKNQTANEIIIKKSRFITYLAPVSTPIEATNFINTISKQNYLATHNVWAYIIKDENQQLKKYCDDGEPQGTAGIPCLEVLCKRELVNVCVVVTRFFGGIMLGSGGLIRAYSETVKNGLDNSEIITMSLCDEIEVVVDYNQLDTLNFILNRYSHSLISSNYEEKISSIFLIKSTDNEKLENELIEKFNSNISYKKKNQYFFGL